MHATRVELSLAHYLDHGQTKKEALLPSWYRYQAGHGSHTVDVSLALTAEYGVQRAAVSAGTCTPCLVGI